MKTKFRFSAAALGKAVELINHWGFELLRPDEQRLRTRAVCPGDVVKIELRPPGR